MFQQVNSNNNINVTVQSLTDLELAQKLIPISNENLANACLSVLTNFTDTNKQTVYKPSLFYSDLINTPELKRSIVKTDQSRNISAWINKDENNTLIKDKNGRKLLLKLSSIPKENKHVNKKIEEVIKINCSAREKVDYTNKDSAITFVEECNNSNSFFLHLKQNRKIPEKSLRLYEKMLMDQIPDRTDLLMDSRKDNETILSFTEKEVKELGDFTDLFLSLTEIIVNDSIILFMIYFYPLDNLGILFRKLLCMSYEKYRKKFTSICIHSKMVEDRMVHTIYYSYQHNDIDKYSNPPSSTILNRSHLIAISKLFFRTLFSHDWYNLTIYEIKAFEMFNEESIYSTEEKLQHYYRKKDWLYGPLFMDKEEHMKIDHEFLDGCLNGGSTIHIDD